MNVSGFRKLVVSNAAPIQLALTDRDFEGKGLSYHRGRDPRLTISVLPSRPRNSPESVLGYVEPLARVESVQVAEDVRFLTGGRGIEQEAAPELLLNINLGELSEEGHIYRAEIGDINNLCLSVEYMRNLIVDKIDHELSTFSSLISVAEHLKKGDSFLLRSDLVGAELKWAAILARAGDWEIAQRRLEKHFRGFKSARSRKVRDRLGELRDKGFSELEQHA